jgi:hypothetical protein
VGKIKYSDIEILYLRINEKKKNLKISVETKSYKEKRKKWKI